MKFTNDIQISIKDLIWLICVIGAIFASYFALPQKIMADVNKGYVDKEIYAADNRTLDEKFQNIKENIQSIGRAVGARVR